MFPFKKKQKVSSSDTSNSSLQSPSKMSTEWPCGLNVLYEGGNSEAKLDIVAIHGLNGHREETWISENGVHWLRDLLPIDLPDVRIMTWGYDANTHSSDRMSCQYIYDHALELVADLTRERTLTNSTERPIIFVAHSLGGIVVKSALIHADAARQGARYEHRSIKTSTYGIIFMGTPHQGSTGAKLGSVLTNIASIFVAADNHILNNLERDSEWLQQQLGQYGPIASEFVTKFAYEIYETPTLFGHSMMIVPKASAVVPSDADAESIAIHSNHVNMIKYSSRNDTGYKKVSGSLKIMAKYAGETVQSRWEAEVRVNDARSKNTSFYLPPQVLQLNDTTRFVAREDEIQQMHTILKGEGRRRMITLHGLGGIGKTQLAKEYIKRYQRHFSATIWLNARDTTSLQEGYMQAAKRICRHHKSIPMSHAIENRDVEKCVEAVKQWLDEPSNCSWLVVYDNYDNPKSGAPKVSNEKNNEEAGHATLADRHDYAVPQNEEVAQEAYDIRPFFPTTDHGAIILTTRSDEVGFDECIKVRKLIDPNSSLDILASTSHRRDIDQDEAAKSLVQRLDGLPLALVTAGAYLKGVPATTFADYVTLYDDSWRRLQENTPQINSYDHALYSTWNISLRHIKRQNPTSETLLLLWAYFDNEDLWYELLREGLLSKRKEHLKGLVDDRIEFDQATRVLHSHGLIEENELMTELAVESKGYSMHGCVHLWIKHILLGDHHEESWQMEQLAAECVARHIPNNNVQGYWLIQRRLLKHADRCLMRGAELPQSQEDNERIYGYGTLAHLYGVQRQLDKAGIMYKRALQGFERILEPEHKSILTTLNNLGSTYSSQGRFAEAEAIYERALGCHERRFGLGYVPTLNIICELATIYEKQGNTMKAKGMHERALQGYEKALRAGDALTPKEVNNLCKIYVKEGRLTDATKFYKETIQGNGNVLESWHIDAVNGLSLVYFQQQKWADVKEVSQQALQAYNNALGVERAKTFPPAMNVLRNLGFVCRCLGDKDESRRFYLRARDGYKVAFDPSHETYLNVVSELEKLERKLPTSSK